MKSNHDISKYRSEFSSFFAFGKLAKVYLSPPYFAIIVHGLKRSTSFPFRSCLVDIVSAICMSKCSYFCIFRRRCVLSSSLNTEPRDPLHFSQKTKKVGNVSSAANIDSNSPSSCFCCCSLFSPFPLPRSHADDSQHLLSQTVLCA